MSALKVANAVIITTSVFMSLEQRWLGEGRLDYRHLRKKISDAPLEIQKAFQKFVEDKFSQQGLSYKDEFPEVSITSEPNPVPTATAEMLVQESGMLIIREDPFELVGRG